ncbi:MAG: 3,4-dihydroxy-2-butanone-4-phosphate synthase, partial [Patescibacteria group bacterium]
MSKFNTIKEAVAALKEGKIIIVLDDEDRENEGDLIVAASKITPEAVNFMAKEGRGLICVPVDGDIADRLSFYPMTPENKESKKCNFTVSADY